MRRDPINFLYNTGHVTLWCVEVGPVANAKKGSKKEHDWATVDSREWIAVRTASIYKLSFSAEPP